MGLLITASAHIVLPSCCFSRMHHAFSRRCPFCISGSASVSSWASPAHALAKERNSNSCHHHLACGCLARLALVEVEPSDGKRGADRGRCGSMAGDSRTGWCHPIRDPPLPLGPPVHPGLAGQPGDGTACCPPRNAGSSPARTGGGCCDGPHRSHSADAIFAKPWPSCERTCAWTEGQQVRGGFTP